LLQIVQPLRSRHLHAVGKRRWRSLKASFVAGYTKTADPAYIKKHCRQWQRTGMVFLSRENILELS